jgi:hypothetical protein
MFLQARAFLTAAPPINRTLIQMVEDNTIAFLDDECRNRSSRLKQDNFAFDHGRLEEQSTGLRGLLRLEQVPNSAQNHLVREERNANH